MILDTAYGAHNHGRTILFETVYGSKLYGCDLPTSDHDIRGVYMPGLYDFLRAGKDEPSVLVPDSDLGESDDILYYPDAVFVNQVLGMKNNCVEIFFAALQQKKGGARFHPAMDLILSRKDELVTANASGFIGHARQRCSRYMEGDDPRDITLQANKFALAEAQKILDSDPASGAYLLKDIDGFLDALCEHERIEVGPNKHDENVLFIHTRQANLTTRLAEFAKTIESRLERFSKTGDGVSDKQKFKDLSTALRMMETAGELMRTGEIVFPIPTAEQHRDIRQGRYDVPTLVMMINEVQDKVAEWEASSPLQAPYTQGENADIAKSLIAELRFLALKDLDLA